MARNAKRLSALLLALAMCVSLLPATALAEGEEEEAGTIRLVEEAGALAAEPAPAVPEEDAPADEIQESYTGQCGDDLTWTLTEDGVLTITGTGEMWNWGGANGTAPWQRYLDSITAVKLTDGPTSIGQYAFYQFPALTSVELSPSVTSIGYDAFYGCTALTSVSFSEGLLSVNSWAFFYCSSLTDINFPSTLTAIENDSFRSCSSLTSVTIPAGVTSIGNRAFAHCSSLADITVEEGNERYLSLDGILYNKEQSRLIQCPGGKTGEVVIPATVTSMADHAFFGCGSFTDFSVEDGNASYCAMDGILYNKEKTTLVQCPGGWSGEVTIPAGVTDIGNYAFYYCTGLTGVTIPAGVTSIGPWAFCSCINLAEVELPEGVTVIGNYAFTSCGSLTAMTIPASVTGIGDGVFGNCGSLSEIRFKGSAPSLGRYAFQNVTATAYYPADDESWTEEVRQDYGGKLTWVAYETSVLASGECGDDLTWTLYSNGALVIAGTGTNMWIWGPEEAPWYEYRDSILSLALPEGLADLGDYTFYHCSSLTAAELPDSVTYIGPSAFEGCSSLLEIEIPEGVSGIAPRTFAGCESLRSVTLPPCVNVIEGEAFASCSSLESIRLPFCMSSIFDNAFLGCTGLKEIRFTGRAPFLSDSAFSGVEATAYYPSNREGWTEDLLQDYGGAITWEAYEKETEDLVSGRCGDELFWTFNDLGQLTVTGTGDMYDYWTDMTDRNGTPWALYRAYILSAELPDGITGIGAFAFSSCRALESVNLPTGLLRIGAAAFINDSALQGVRIPDGLEQIGQNAFSNSGITFAEIPASVSFIADWAFSSCTGLEAITVDPENETYSSLDGVLYNKEQTVLITCPGAKPGVLIIPETVTALESHSFSDCDGLTGVEIPDGVHWIGEHAFEYCDGLTDMTIPSGVHTIHQQTFHYCTGLTSVTIPHVSEIHRYAFAGCYGLNEIRFLSSAPSFGENVFGDVTANAYYPASDESWTEDKRQGYGGTITWLPIPASGQCGDDLTWTLDEEFRLTITGTGDMWEWNAAEEVPWHDYALSIRALSLPLGLTNIGNYAFSGCGRLESAEIPEAVADIGREAFADCAALTAVRIPEGVTEIRKGSFRGCKALQRVRIADSVTAIGEGAFSGCRALTAVMLPKGLEALEEKAFEGCSGLDWIAFPGAAPAFAEFSFWETGTTAYYPGRDETWTEDVRQSYGGIIDWVPMLDAGWCGDDLTWILLEDQTLLIFGVGDMWDWLPEQAPWYDFHDSITSVSLPEGLTCIGNRAFWDCGSLSSVTIPYGVTHIGSHAFRMCSSLASVEIPASVTRIDEYVFYDCGKLTTAGPLDGDYRIRFGWADSIPDGAFYNCNHLTSITFPEGTTSIGKYAFWCCSNLKSVEIPESVSEIGTMAFNKCTSLSSITIPGNVTSIGDFAFQECKGLKSLVIEEGVTDLGLGTFNSCTALERVTLPDSLVSIGNSVFYYCESLNNVTIPSHVISIEDYAFNCCISLTDITIPEGVTRLGDCAFSLCKNMTRIVFLGGAPGMGSNCFYDVTATAYYPADDSSWTEAVRQDYGGTLTWVPYTGEPVINPFSDVKEGKYYYEPVLWAYYHDPQITGGISETEFGPSKTCTREQIVTFLWKAMGAPEPTTTVNPFQDVKSTKYYYKPVLWAVENGITGGVDATHFGVGKPCTREQAMTFLWKACGSPEPTTTDNPFQDVKSTKYYYKAVLWAVENGITGGVDATHFGVGKPCTRGQIVTFLYKALAD